MVLLVELEPNISIKEDVESGYVNNNGFAFDSRGSAFNSLWTCGSHQKSEKPTEFPLIATH